MCLYKNFLQYPHSKESYSRRTFRNLCALYLKPQPGYACKSIPRLVW